MRSAFVTHAANEEAFMRVIQPHQAAQFVDTMPVQPGLREAELDHHIAQRRRVVLLRCGADACNQGRMACPTPYSCHVAAGDDEPPRRGMTFGETAALLAVYAVSAVAVVSALAWVVDLARRAVL